MNASSINSLGWAGLYNYLDNASAGRMQVPSVEMGMSGDALSLLSLIGALVWAGIGIAGWWWTAQADRRLIALYRAKVEPDLPPIEGDFSGEFFRNPRYQQRPWLWHVDAVRLGSKVVSLRTRRYDDPELKQAAWRARRRHILHIASIFLFMPLPVLFWAIGRSFL